MPGVKEFDVNLQAAEKSDWFWWLYQEKMYQDCNQHLMCDSSECIMNMIKWNSQSEELECVNCWD